MLKLSRCKITIAAGGRRAGFFQQNGDCVMSRFVGGPQATSGKSFDSTADWVYTNFLTALVPDNFAVAVQAGAGVGAGGDQNGGGASSADLGAAPVSHETPDIDQASSDQAPVVDQAMANSLDASSVNGVPGGPVHLMRAASAEHDQLSSSPFSDLDAPAPAHVAVDDGKIVHLGDAPTSDTDDLADTSAQASADTLLDFHTDSADGPFPPGAGAPAMVYAAAVIPASSHLPVWSDPGAFWMAAAPAQGSLAAYQPVHIDIEPAAVHASAAASASVPATLAELDNPTTASPDDGTAAILHVTGVPPLGVQLALDESGLSVNGAGLKVGVLSDSFNDLGGAASDEAAGLLPPAADVQVLEDLQSGGNDEGRAMMQIVHDIAPGADLDFYTAFESEQDFANGILALAAAGCKVICDDVYYYDEPFFQNGIVAQAIQTVEAEGVTYITSAGNNANNAYQAFWTPISGTFDGVSLHDTESFGGSLVQTITLTGPTPEAMHLLLEWNQPYGQATSDVEILVFENGNQVGSSIGEPNNPWAEFTFSAAGTYQIAIENVSGPDPGQIKEIAAGDGLPVTISGANEGTVFGHAMTPGVITAGAVDAWNTPAYGVSPSSETFSSSGAGTELFFANNGTALSPPEVLNPVAVSGLDDIQTSVIEGGLGDFFGTSAASASLAGVAALLLEANPDLTPAQVETIMEETAIPMANPAVSGAGLVQVDPAVATALANFLMIEADGSTSLTESFNQYYIDSSGTALTLKDGGAPVMGSQFGAWTPIAVEAVAGGYEVAWKLAGADQYTVWTTDSNGNYLSNTAPVSGTSYTIESLETVFHHDLNGDGVIGPVTTVIESDGSNSLAQFANEYVLDSNGSGPLLSDGGTPVVAGQFGGWTPIAMEPEAGGYEVVWKLMGSDQYTVWTTDSSGNYLSNTPPVSGTSYTIESLETTFHHDLNGDGVIGPVTTVIEADGSNSLTQVANEYFLDSSGSGPSLKDSGVAVTAGQFGSWTPIAMEPVAGGYEVVWKVAGADQYTVWTTDSNGNFLSDIPQVSGNSYAIESLETTFHHDLNGDGMIGPTTTVIEADGSNSLAQAAGEYFLDSSGSGPSLKYNGAAVTAGQFGTWAPIAMEPVAGGYEVVWKVAGADQYTVWTTDSSGNFLSDIPQVSGSSYAIESLEATFHHDLNGDGHIGLVVGTGATLEVPGTESGSVLFGGWTGTLQLDTPAAFTGSISDFTGNGTFSGSDHIDLTTLAFNNLVQADSTYNTSSGILQVSNGTTVDDLQFAGIYTQANFSFASDGHGGTIVYDPPAPIDITDNRTITGSTDLNGSQITVESGAALTLSNVTAPNATITNNGTVNVTNNSAVNLIAGAGQDNFVFAPNFGQATISHFVPGTDTRQIDHTLFAGMNALLASLHDDGHGDAIITDAAHDTITLQNVTTAQLLAHAGDFHLV